MLWADSESRTTRQPDASVDRSGWLDRALVAASLLVLTAGYRTVVEGNDWWITTLLVTLVATLTCAVLRGLGVRLVAPFAAVVLFVTIVWVFVPETLAAGFPTPSSVGALSELVESARVIIVEEKAPVAAARGIVLLVAVAFGSLVVVADAFLELRRAPAWIGLLLLGVFAVPAMVSGRTPGFWLFVVAAVPWLVMLHVGRTSSRGSAVGNQVPAVLIAVVSLAGALVLPTVAPDIRAAAASWGDPPPSVFGRGINPMLELGQNLRRNSTAVALTYTTTAEVPPYLKVATLRDFTGKTWIPGSTLPADRFEGRIGLREGIETTMDTTRITIEGLDSTMLPVPYVAQDTNGLEGVWRFERMGMTVRSESTDTSGQEYSVNSLTITPTAEQMRQLSTVIGPSLQPYVDLPDEVPPSIARTAREVTSSAPTDYDKALALQSFFRSGEFRYSETAPVADDYDGNGLSVVAEFLERKAGYCVHFASAMAVMARTLDIPSRVAVGYAPGRSVGLIDGEPVYENTSDDLHAWTELFFEGAGWVRFDPTTSIGSATLFDEPAMEGSEAPSDANSQTPRGERNEGSATVGDEATASGTAPRTLAVTGVVVMLILAGPAVVRELRRRRRLRSSTPDSLWRELEDVCRDLGLDVPDTDTPRGFAGRLENRPGVDADALERLLHQVEIARFARESTSDAGPATTRDAVSLTAGLRAGTPRPDRWRALLLPRSLGPRPVTARPTYLDEHMPA
ncbi:transglutaminase TgpA family protein [Aeromicrobium sp.]|uniref:transglutaminase TgpA family protein n=1 Tax=Aeromicrobium sp. TaxID=1871063 RepID=UPI003D6C551F